MARMLLAQQRISVRLRANVASRSPLNTVSSWRMLSTISGNWR
jgi:hypothetical protein